MNLSIKIVGNGVDYDTVKLKETINFLYTNQNVMINSMNKEQKHHFAYFTDLVKKSENNKSSNNYISNLIKEKYETLNDKSLKLGSIGAYIFGCFLNTNCSDNMCTPFCVTGFKPQNLPGFYECEKNIILFKDKSSYDIIKKVDSKLCWIFIPHNLVSCDITTNNTFFNKKLKNDLKKLKINKYNFIIIYSADNYKKIHDVDIDFTYSESSKSEFPGWGVFLALLIVLLLFF